VSEALFGAPTGLLQRLNRSEVRVLDVRAAVDRLVAAGVDGGLELAVLDGVRGPMLVLDDAGRRTRVLLGELALEMTRAQALDRSAETAGELQVEGPVGLWTSAAPGIDTAVLVRPETMLARLVRRGLSLRDPHLVVTPRRPVACADAGVARRLVAEATDTCATLPWRAVTELGWA
jgi:hypothetical protein